MNQGHFSGQMSTQARVVRARQCDYAHWRPLPAKCDSGLSSTYYVTSLHIHEMG